MKTWIIRAIKAFFFLFIFALILAILMPSLGRFDFNQYKENSLEIWQKQVLMYKNTSGHLPQDLYEVYLFYKDEINLKDFPIEYYRYLEDHKRELLKKNPAYFSEITMYEYVQDGQHWYVKVNFRTFS